MAIKDLSPVVIIDTARVQTVQWKKTIYCALQLMGLMTTMIRPHQKLFAFGCKHLSDKLSGSWKKTAFI